MAIVKSCAIVFGVFVFCFCNILGQDLQTPEVDDYLVIFYEKIVQEANFSSKCLEQLNETQRALQKRQFWALQMVDASAKPQSGILMGNVMHLGNYDECLEINADTKSGRIRGKYCTALYAFKGMNIEQDLEYPNLVNLRFSFGICMPSACQAEEIQNLVYAQERYFESDITLRFFEDFCYSENKKEALSIAAICAISFYSLVALIIVLSTFYDVCVYQKSENKNELFIAFSLYTNSKKMFNTKSTEGNLSCLNGIRVISMMWIVFAHGFMTVAFAPLVNALSFYEWNKKVENMMVPGATMAVDTFFAVSGLLVVFVYLKSIEKGVKFNIFVFYLHRYLRLTPALAALVLFYGTLTVYIGNGPIWSVVYTYLQESCEKRWWPTLLYIQNYNNPDTQCIGQSWYLAVDTQLYFLSPLILIPIVRWPKKTIFGIILVGCASMLGAFIVTWQSNFGAVFFDQEPEQSRKYFVTTHFRMTPWLVGAIFGYVIFKTKEGSIRLTKVQVLLLWAFSLAVMCAAVFGQVDFIKYTKNRIRTSIFNAFARPSWAFALCVVIFLCVHGYGGIINRALSSRLFTVMIRLNYSIYLLHQIVMAYFVAQVKSTKYLDNKLVYHRFWGDFAFTFALSVIFSLAFESPIIAIEKIIFKRGASTKLSSLSQQNLRTNLDASRDSLNSKSSALTAVITN